MRIKKPTREPPVVVVHPNSVHTRRLHSFTVVQGKRTKRGQKIQKKVQQRHTRCVYTHMQYILVFTVHNNDAANLDVDYTATYEANAQCAVHTQNEFNHYGTHSFVWISVRRWAQIPVIFKVRAFCI